MGIWKKIKQFLGIRSPSEEVLKPETEDSGFSTQSAEPEKAEECGIPTPETETLKPEMVASEIDPLAMPEDDIEEVPAYYIKRSSGELEEPASDTADMTQDEAMKILLHLIKVAWGPNNWRKMHGYPLRRKTTKRKHHGR